MNRSLEEQIEDLRAALCMAEDEIDRVAGELENAEAERDEAVLDCGYYEDILSEIRTLCGVPWDVRTPELPEYLRVRVLLNDEVQRNGCCETDTTSDQAA